MPTKKPPPTGRHWPCETCGRPLGDRESDGRRTRGLPPTYCAPEPDQIAAWIVAVESWEVGGRTGAPPRKPVSDCSLYARIKERMEELAPRVFRRMDLSRFREERSELMSLANRRGITDEMKAANRRRKTS